MSTAPFLAPARDSYERRGRPKTGSTVSPFIPGYAAALTSSAAISANTDYYSPIFLSAPAVLTSLKTDVVSGVTGNMRIGLYVADLDLQPVGAPLVDSGSISVSAAAIKTYTPGTPVFLAAGRYLTVLNSDVAPTIAYLRAGTGAVTVASYQNAVTSLSVGRTYAAFPTPGTAWTTEQSTLAHMVFLVLGAA